MYEAADDPYCYPGTSVLKTPFTHFARAMVLRN